MESQMTCIKSLAVKNYRLFNEKEFVFNPKFNVLIGQNATGKSTMLDALKMPFCAYLLAFGVSGDSTITDRDVRGRIIHHKGAQSTVERFYPSEVRGAIDILGSPCKYSFIRDGNPKEHKDTNVFSLARKYANRLQGDDNFILPLFAYYGVSRASRLDDSPSPTRLERVSRSVGYENSLGAPVCPQRFAEWLKNITYISLQEGVKSELMQATLNAVCMCLPEVEGIEFRVKENSVLVSFANDTIMPFNNLSDGYRSVMALVADIAHRAARLNPHLGGDVAKTTPGVVLIDELDLHLHPKWQRRVVGDIKRAFPLIQFITTTHSPFIIQSLEPGEVINLGGTQPTEGVFTKLSIEDVVEDIMGVDMPQRSKRYQDMYNAAVEYFDLLNKATDANETERATLEDKLNELSEPFSDDVAYYAFLNSKRIAFESKSSSEEEQ